VNNAELNRQLQRLTHLLSRAKDLQGDFELLGHWGRYMCVLAAGFLENAVKELYGDRARRSASPEVESFVLRTLERVQNPNATRFFEIASSFSAQWGKDLDTMLDDDSSRRRSAVNSIMSNRHLIVHGKNSDISVGRVREYLDASLEILDLIEVQCS
jgi:hypothetical protein